MDYMHVHAHNSAKSYLVAKHYPDNAKHFPNNYPSLCMRPDYMVSPTKPILATRAVSKSPVRTRGSDNYLTSSPNLLQRRSEQLCARMAKHAKDKAKMRIFLAVLLRSWRNRRSEAIQLRKKLTEMEKSHMDIKNQMHVVGSCNRVEQRRSYDLTCQLKHAIESIAEKKCVIEGMSSNVMRMKGDISYLEKELKAKTSELEKVTAQFLENKNELVRVSTEKCHLETHSRKEKKSSELAEIQKKKLLQEILDSNAAHRVTEEKLRRDISYRDDELRRANNKIRTLEIELKSYKESSLGKDDICGKHDCQLKEDLQILQEQVSQLQCIQHNSLSNWLYECWQQIDMVKNSTCEKLHVIAYYLLPATPPPTKFLVKCNSFIM